MLTGNMQVCTDSETKLAFWKQGDEQYYPLGPTDPDYCMLKFVAVKGNYYFYGLKEMFIIDDVHYPAEMIYDKIPTDQDQQAGIRTIDKTPDI
jgi:hypothetical protein